MLIPVETHIVHKRVTTEQLTKLEAEIPIWQGRICDYILMDVAYRSHLSKYQRDLHPGEDGKYGVTYHITLLTDVQESTAVLNDLIGG